MGWTLVIFSVYISEAIESLYILGKHIKLIAVSLLTRMAKIYPILL